MRKGSATDGQVYGEHPTGSTVLQHSYIDIETLARKANMAPGELEELVRTGAVRATQAGENLLLVDYSSFKRYQELLIATDKTGDRWEYEAKSVYDTDALEAAYRDEMYTAKGRALLDASDTDE